ncbi:RAD55 family ATPase [Haloglomus salinum]|jgi:KaiC/GvpD/RAD55 family RecA-like ATPase|uniref:RAD55 family ATPase n=1 Tax=Haloglomus salinum TaxID=2962673 RepID=UPI0020C944CF|nr:RAD55 family ATPase [Haloglomus salinum]
MRVPSGVPGFDQLVDGGLPANRLHVVSGPPGSGKTTFCSQFVTQGVENGQDCLYVTMHETKAELRQDMANFTFGFSGAIESGAIEFLNLMTNEGKRTLSKFGSESGLTNRLVGAIQENDIDRVIIDSTMLLEHFAGETGTTNFLSALKRTDATVLLISEMTDPASYANEHYLAHGVIFFHNFLDGSGMTRGIQVLKMRGTAIDTDIRRLTFSERGLRVNPDRTVET